jgi:alanine racemase
LSPFCDYFAVASLNEGVKLRIAGIEKPILCLLPVKNVLRAVEYNIEFAVHSLAYCREIINCCEALGVTARVHVAVNTGMNRLGIDNLNELQLILAEKRICVCGVFSHLYNPSNKIDRLKQYEKFIPFYELVKANNSKIIGHLAASSFLGIESQFQLDMVRVGLAIYGYNAINSAFRLKPAMKIITPALLNRQLNSGDSLLYGNYKIKENQTLSICAYGYQNGMRKGIKEGLNNACMNLCAVSGEAEYFVIMNDAFEYANRVNSIPYEVLTAFGNNCKRVYHLESNHENNFR